ncbi:hypothetical protein GCM10012319_68200 [Comamonas sp. KCTC 72670]|nr:hypothetical protein GCM10012319_68200 [Comamonas sp. KCTC 72670]
MHAEHSMWSAATAPDAFHVEREEMGAPVLASDAECSRWALRGFHVEREDEARVLMLSIRCGACGGCPCQVPRGTRREELAHVEWMPWTRWGLRGFHVEREEALHAHVAQVEWWRSLSPSPVPRGT